MELLVTQWGSRLAHLLVLLLDYLLVALLGYVLVHLLVLLLDLLLALVLVDLWLEWVTPLFMKNNNGYI